MTLLSQAVNGQRINLKVFDIKVSLNRRKPKIIYHNQSEKNGETSKWYNNINKLKNKLSSTCSNTQCEFKSHICLFTHILGI